ncbi:MAG: hypothetical protein GY847_02385 [Proteobacteria bacterium]|nr:hypothetical protein [Pseudomonadota bacterium]
MSTELNQMKHIDSEIIGVSALTGDIVPMDEWAEQVDIVDPKHNKRIDGRIIRKLLGVNGKSWSPDLFRDPNTIVRVGKAALESAEILPDEVEAIITVSCTPYELNLGQDSFRFARALGLSEDVLLIHLETGCGGLARMMNIVNKLSVNTILVLAYNVVSSMTIMDGPNRLAYFNGYHPMENLVWMSAALFSDGAGGIVLRRTEKNTGFAFYTRDAHSFGDGPPFTDPIVHFPGGGVLHPPGFHNCEASMFFAMSGRIIAEYYNKGMMLNHQSLLDVQPNYVDEVRRIYTHQAGPALVKSFKELSGISSDKAPSNAQEIGNTVSSCTIQLLYEDIEKGIVKEGDTICFSVVGAGPERGAFLIPNKTRKVVHVLS